MQAIILAAGMGKRLKELTANNTKCMVKVNGITLIERMLSKLDKQSLNKIVIVVGYEGQKLMDYINTLPIKTPIQYIENPIYDKTNNIYSLALAKDELIQDDTLLLESDLIFEDGVLEALIADPYPTLTLVDQYESWMDGTVIKIAEDNSIQSFIPGKNFDFAEIDSYYKTVNIYKFSRDFSANCYVPFLVAYAKSQGNNEYYEQVLQVITMLDSPEIRAKKIDGKRWYEIDDVQDLDIAESMFEDADKKVSRISQRYGGYWRYPKLLDFCYLVNPYFPPQRLKDEMKANFEALLTQYPSGMRVNTLLAAKNFGVKQEYILVGNGASELIKGLMEQFSGKIGFIRPTFEEYPNRCTEENSVIFWPGSSDFRYRAQEVMAFFTGKGIAALVLINPDNPTGNYIPKAELLTLAAWAEEQKIHLILDESFADFSDEEENTLLDNRILERYPHLIVIKSISKSFGVPGLRLGIMASSEAELVTAIKKELPIWNINSFGEFYLQIAQKYSKHYSQALNCFRTSRTAFLEGLGCLQGIKVLPTQANYVMLEVTGNISAVELTKRLLNEYKILIKDLSSKIPNSSKQFIRLAIRDDADNQKLLHALEEILSEQ